MLLNPAPHQLTEAFNLGRGCIAAIDQEIAMHHTDLRPHDEATASSFGSRKGRAYQEVEKTLDRDCFMTAEEGRD